MTNQELLEKLNSFLKEITEMLALGDMGLLKSEELHNTKHRIEDGLNNLKPQFGKIDALKIEKTIPMWRNTPKIGMFLNSSQVNPELSPLHILLQELIKSESGSEPVKAVAVPDLHITGTTINQAIADAKTLLGSHGGATSAVDRVHTVLHGYLKQVCKQSGISYADDASLNQLMNLLKEKHPALSMKNGNADQILKSMANVLDKLNPIRNNASLAHPNSQLLDQNEAMLVVNTVNTLLSYLNSKFS